MSKNHYYTVKGTYITKAKALAIQFIRSLTKHYRMQMFSYQSATLHARAPSVCILLHMHWPQKKLELTHLFSKAAL